MQLDQALQPIVHIDEILSLFGVSETVFRDLTRFTTEEVAKVVLTYHLRRIHKDVDAERFGKILEEYMPADIVSSYNEIHYVLWAVDQSIIQKNRNEFFDQIRRGTKDVTLAMIIMTLQVIRWHRCRSVACVKKYLTSYVSREHLDIFASEHSGLSFVKDFTVDYLKRFSERYPPSLAM